MFRLAMILLQLQSDFSHPLRALAWFDFHRFLALRGGSGAHFLVEFLLATLAFPFDALDDVDGAAFGYVGCRGRSIRAFVVVRAEGGEFAKCDGTAARERSGVGELRALCETVQRRWDSNCTSSW